MKVDYGALAVLLLLDTENDGKSSPQLLRKNRITVSQRVLWFSCPSHIVIGLLGRSVGNPGKSCFMFVQQ